MVLHVPAQTEIDTAALAADLRGVIGQLIRRLRTENLFPLNQASVLGRLDRCGSQSVSDLAAGERIRPQSMAQTVGDLEADGLVERKPDPGDRRRALVILTAAGKSRIEADRRAREGWLATAFEEMPDADLATIERSIEILGRVVESDV
jgi:DNA-binding MarR family transcriptional regulator